MVKGLYLWTICAVSAGMLLFGCGKSEEAYTFEPSRDVLYMLSGAGYALPIWQNVKDSLHNGDTLKYKAKLYYISGDTANYPNHATPIVYALEYDSVVVDFDGKSKTGRFRIFDYPTGSDFKYSVVYDTVTINGYSFSGSVVMNLAQNTAYTYKLNAYNFNLFGKNRLANMDIDADVVYSSSLNKITYDFNRTTGESTDENSFKSQGEGIVFSQSCGYFIEGEVLVKPRLFPWRGSNLGSGQCDNLVTVSGPDKSLTFILP